MAQKLIVSFFLLCGAALSSAASCSTVTSTSYSTSDGTIVSQVAYIAEFVLKCSQGDSIPLFAEYAGRISPVAKIGDNKYQVSWNEEIKTSSKGEYKVRLFDEEGFASLRKAAQRGAGEDLSSVKELATVVVKHPGVFKGPWVNSEVLATVLAIVIAYTAIYTRSKIEN